MLSTKATTTAQNLGPVGYFISSISALPSPSGIGVEVEATNPFSLFFPLSSLLTAIWTAELLGSKNSPIVKIEIELRESGIRARAGST